MSSSSNSTATVEPIKKNKNKKKCVKNTNNDNMEKDKKKELIPWKKKETQLLSKQETLRLWNNRSTKHKTSIFSQCDFCLVADVNVIFPIIVSFNNCKYFSCIQCQKTLPAAFKHMKSNNIDEQRLKVWISRHHLQMCAKCTVCNTEEINILSSSWHVAHITADANGGSREIKNLTPTCISCNLTMKTSNLIEFKRSLLQTSSATINDDNNNNNNNNNNCSHESKYTESDITVITSLLLRQSM